MNEAYGQIAKTEDLALRRIENLSRFSGGVSTPLIRWNNPLLGGAPAMGLQPWHFNGSVLGASHAIRQLATRLGAFVSTARLLAIRSWQVLATFWHCLTWPTLELLARGSHGRSAPP